MATIHLLGFSFYSNAAIDCFRQAHSVNGATRSDRNAQFRFEYFTLYFRCDVDLVLHRGCSSSVRTKNILPNTIYLAAKLRRGLTPTLIRVPVPFAQRSFSPSLAP